MSNDKAPELTDYEKLMLRSQQVISNHLCNLVINEIRKTSYEIKDDAEKLENLNVAADYHQTLQLFINKEIDQAVGPLIEQSDSSGTKVH